MPSVYLSPSTQEFNPYINGGNEEQYMNLLADALEPYLLASGITVTRNTPDMTAASSIRASNSGNYDLHLALHSNASPDDMAGSARGPIAFYYPGSDRSRRAATQIAQNFEEIYPDPSLVKAVPTTRIGEVSRTRAPAVLVEVAYHDNPQDAQWIKDNIQSMAYQLARAVTSYFGVPLIPPQEGRSGTVATPMGGPVNIRSGPGTDTRIIGRANNGDRLSILGQVGNWYAVNHSGTMGYIRSDYVRA